METNRDEAPPQSPAEIKAMEEVAMQTVQTTVATCVLLYLCSHPLKHIRTISDTLLQLLSRSTTFRSYSKSIPKILESRMHIPIRFVYRHGDTMEGWQGADRIVSYGSGMIWSYGFGCKHEVGSTIRQTAAKTCNSIELHNSSNYRTATSILQPLLIPILRWKQTLFTSATSKTQTNCLKVSSCSPMP